MSMEEAVPPDENSERGRGSGSFYEQDRALIARLLEGASQSEISREFGLTRERVRQRLERNGFKGRNYRWIPDRAIVAAALEETASLQDAAEQLGLTPLRLRTAVSHHDLTHAFEQAQERWREQDRLERRQAYQRSLITKVRARALAVGHTPTADELRLVGIHHVELNRVFGSVPNAMRAAGLIPNEVGRPPAALPTAFEEMFTPTPDVAESYQRAEEIRTSLEFIPEPVGSEHPPQVRTSTLAYYRDPRVVAWVLNTANGVCEACGSHGYETDSGSRYLEVHHVIPLSLGGPDTVWNAVAVCETCHGKLHRWKYRAAYEADLYSRIERLRRPLTGEIEREKGAGERI